MTATLLIGDVFERLREIADGSIDLIVTSPPFLALRSYLPADHPDKAKEIGSEPTPAAFIDTLLALTAEWRRVLAPHGSLCVELGDTYCNKRGYGSPDPEYGERSRVRWEEARAERFWPGKVEGWPLEKSLTGIPHAYQLSLIYGWNVLDRHAADSPAGRWRARNYLAWARPNPPVGALGDKFRPATSFVTVACVNARRYFDLDAVRQPYSENSHPRTANGVDSQQRSAKTSPDGNRDTLADRNNDGAGAPPLDWHNDCYDGPTGARLWVMATAPYAGSHYAAFPRELPRRLIEAMCPQRVCRLCGRPAERIVEDLTDRDEQRRRRRYGVEHGKQVAERGDNGASTSFLSTNTATVGWSDCGHNDWRRGVVLDPFAGSGTTLQAAIGLGRDAIGIDLDPRNAHLAAERCGMFLEVR